MKKQIPCSMFAAAIYQFINRHAFGFAILLILLITSFKPEPAATNTKIGVVDLELVVARSAAGLALQQRLASFQKSIQAEVDQMSQEARSLRQRMEEGINSLSQDKLAELQKQFEDKQIDIRRFQDDKQREGQKMQNEGLKEIEQQLEPVVKSMVEQMGLEILLNNTPGLVIWSGETVDYTGKIIEMMNN